MKKILLIGEGGQGIQTIAKMIAKAASKNGFNTTYIPSFGVEQRGGVSLAYIQIDKNPIGYSRFDKADILVAFCDRAIEKSVDFITSETIFIYDNSAINQEILSKISSQIKKSVAVPAQDIAKKKYIPKVLNMVLLGALLKYVDEVIIENIEELIIEDLKAKIAKNPEIKELNFKAINEGFSIADKSGISSTLAVGKEEDNIQQIFENEKVKWERFPNLCKGCSLCITRCPVGALKFSDEVGFLGNPMPIIDIEKCIGCGMCMNTCPDGAINLEKK